MSVTLKHSASVRKRDEREREAYSAVVEGETYTHHFFHRPVHPMLSASLQVSDPDIFDIIGARTSFNSTEKYASYVD